MRDIVHESSFAALGLEKDEILVPSHNDIQILKVVQVTGSWHHIKFDPLSWSVSFLRLCFLLHKLQDLKTDMKGITHDEQPTLTFHQKPIIVEKELFPLNPKP